jgi:signal transduction histidine kinase
VKGKSDSKPTRFALVIFVALVIFCLAQLSWWIVYQIDLGKQLSRYKSELLEQKIEVITLTTNQCFQQRVNLVSLAKSLTYDVRNLLDSLLADQAIIGYQVVDHISDSIINTGTVDSTFYATLDENEIIYFDPGYPNRLIGNNEKYLSFQASGNHGGDSMTWVRPDMFSINAELEEHMENESRGRIIMFASEGSFFIIVIIFGAFLIYRTLQKSEDLKFRQQNFIHAVTHEFRTPLTSLRLYLETLQAGKLDPAKIRGFYSKMLDDCHRLDSMVDNVLEAGRTGKDDYKLNLTENDLAEDIEEYLDNLQPLIEGRNGRVVKNLEENIRVRSDFQALGRAIRAIIENALNYSPPEKRTIHVSLHGGKKYAEIVISDHGIGIPHEEQKNIFDRFYRVGNESTRTVKGTGLGLFLVRQAIEAHSGEIEVKSDGPNQGSIFTIKLPRVY